MNKKSNAIKWAGLFLALLAINFIASKAHSRYDLTEEKRILFPYALLQYGEQQELINLFPSSKRNITVSELNNAEAMMEYQFARAMDRMIHPSKPLVAYAIGNKEPMGPETYSLQHAI